MAEIRLHVTGDLLADVVAAYARTSMPSALLTRVCEGLSAEVTRLEGTTRTEDRLFVASVLASLLVLRDDVYKRESAQYLGNAD